ncbi:hypothetical protein PIB30_003109, partial [Stylosanthes scabra]|nr:hypothetical protein [Stylosanthes scabra]
EFENQNEEERVQNESPITSSQVEREMEKIWPAIDFDYDLIVKAEEDTRQLFA